MSATTLVDTNVLIVLLDDEDERRIAVLREMARIAEQDGVAEVGEGVLIECLWVLISRFGWRPEHAAASLRALIETPPLAAWDPAVARSTLVTLEANPGLDPVDCVLAARSKLDGTAVMTFDRGLDRALRKGR